MEGTPEKMPELSGEKVAMLLAQAETARAVLKFTEQWTKIPVTSEFYRGVAHTAETVARWTHERFGLPPEPGKCPCYHCWRVHQSHER